MKVNNRDYTSGIDLFETEEAAKSAAAFHAYVICRCFSVNDGMMSPLKVDPGRSGRLNISNISAEAIGYNGSDVASHASQATFFTAKSRETDDEQQNHEPGSDWYQHLEKLSILPIASFDETNWSGRGQHVEFEESDRPELSRILRVGDVLGHSATAIVEQVQCKRISLARKRIKCNWRLRREDAITEVTHLQRLRHSHIVRGVGTYVIGNELGILLYPAAEFNLETFLDYGAAIDKMASPLPSQLQALHTMQHDIRCFFSCLISTIGFIHRQRVKHMDIKPSNILVKERPRRIPTYKIYLADFGISRSYDSSQDVETDSRTSFTRTYAAPEVILQEKRGFPADIFSLGCVFLEMLAVLAEPMQREALIKTRMANSEEDYSYQANLSSVFDNFNTTGFVDPRCHVWLEEAKKMMNPNAEARPDEGSLNNIFGHGQDCCYVGSEPFEAAVEVSHGPMDH